MANIVANPYEQEAQEIARRRAFAEALRQQGMQQQGPRMVGGVRQQSSVLDGLNQALKAYSGRVGVEQADQQTRDLQTRRQEALKGFFKSMPQDQQTTQQQLVGDRPGAGSFEDVTTTKKATPEDYMKWLASGTEIGPEAVQIGQVAYQNAVRGQERADDRTFRTETLKSEQAFRDQQAAEARTQRMQELELRLQDSRLSREQNADLRREMATLAAANRPQAAVTPVTVMRDGKPTIIDARTNSVIGEAPPKESKGGQLPVSALKLQNESLDVINAAAAINPDIESMIDQIDKGKIQLGPLKNLTSQAANALGMSSPESQNFATLKATLENMRNASLRLNKGVQTEGDAVREWNALIANINDPKVVTKRLREIQKINSRAIDLQKMNIDVIRQNFGLDPMDISSREKVGAAVTPATQDAGAPPPGAVRLKGAK